MNISTKLITQHAIISILMAIFSFWTFDLFGQAPTIISFSPADGPVSTSVTISGTGFSSTAGSNIVYFGATQATVTSASNTQLIVSAPAGGTYKPISVTVNGLSAWSASPFIITFSGAGILTGASFGPHVDFPAGSLPISVSLADLDRDGKSDIASSDGFGAMDLFKNISTQGSINSGSLAASTNISDGAYSYRIVTEDLDGDGLPDIAIGNKPNQSLSLYRNLNPIGTLSASLFSSRIDFPGNGDPTDVAIGDLDGDGKPDLVTVNDNESISIFQNIGTEGTLSTSSFGPRIDINVGETPYNVAIADLDGDGKLDLAVADRADQRIDLFRNLLTAPGTISASSFSNAVLFYAGSVAEGIAVGDLDKDGKPEIVTLTDNNSLLVFKNTSTPGTISTSSFASGVEFDTGGSPSDIAIGDLNGDGNPDLVVTNEDDSQVGIYINTEVGGTITTNSFANAVLYQTGSSPVSVAIGDVDNDGKNDIAVANSDDGTISILKNQMGPLPLAPVITSFSPVAALAGATVTIIGKNFNTTTAGNIVYLGATQATVLTATATQLTVKVPVGASYAFISETARGLTAYSNLQFIPIFSGGGAINQNTFVDFQDYSVGGNPLSVFLNDLDGDGLPDLSVYNSDDLTFTVLQNTTSGNTAGFNNQFTFGNSEESIVVADYNGDGKMDVLANGDPDDETIDVFTNSGVIGNLGNNVTSVDINNVNSNNIASDDLDGDGQPDLVILDYNSRLVSVFQNINGSFSQNYRLDLSVGNSPIFVSIGDLDGDGLPEILVTNQSDNTVSVFRNNGHPGYISFNDAQNVTVTGSPVQAITGDLDGDGKPELVVIGNPSVVSVFQNQINVDVSFPVAFANRFDYAVGSGPDAVAIGDLNGDGKPDLAVANDNDNTVSVLKNTSSPGAFSTTSFATQVTYATGGEPSAIVIGDMNNDGAADMAISNYDDNTVSLFLNTSLSPQIIITTQPQNTTVCDVGEGSLSVVATGASDLSYQWQIKSSEPDEFGNYSYSDLDNGSAYSGVNTPTLNINNVPGTYACVISSELLPTTMTQDATVDFSNSPDAPGAEGASGCLNSTITLTASGGDPGDFRWYTVETGGTYILGQFNNTYTTPELIVTTTYYVSLVAGSCESTRTSAVATITDCGNSNPPVIAASTSQAAIGGTVVIDLIPLLSDPGGTLDLTTLKILKQPGSGAQASLDAEGKLTVNYTGLSFSGTDEMSIEVCNLAGACTDKILNIEVGDALVVYDGFSPNGDDKNQTWYIQNIDVLPDTQLNHVTIYNRWGDSVFDADNYNNTSAVFAGQTYSGNDLPSGIYFYKISFASGRKELTGYVSLKR